MTKLNQLQDVRREFVRWRTICKICNEKFKDASFIERCQHVFCFLCIQKHSADSNKCPVCDKEFAYYVSSISSNLRCQIFSVKKPPTFAEDVPEEKMEESSCNCQNDGKPGSCNHNFCFICLNQSLLKLKECSVCCKVIEELISKKNTRKNVSSIKPQSKQSAIQNQQILSQSTNVKGINDEEKEVNDFKDVVPKNVDLCTEPMSEEIQSNVLGLGIESDCFKMDEIPVSSGTCESGSSISSGTKCYEINNDDIQSKINSANLSIEQPQTTPEETLLNALVLQTGKHSVARVDEIPVSDSSCKPGSTSSNNSSNESRKVDSPGKTSCQTALKEKKSKRKSKCQESKPSKDINDLAHHRSKQLEKSRRGKSTRKCQSSVVADRPCSEATASLGRSEGICQSQQDCRARSCTSNNYGPQCISSPSEPRGTNLGGSSMLLQIMGAHNAVSQNLSQGILNSTFQVFSMPSNNGGNIQYLHQGPSMYISPYANQGATVQPLLHANQRPNTQSILCTNHGQVLSTNQWLQTGSQPINLMPTNPVQYVQLLHSPAPFFYF